MYKIIFISALEVGTDNSENFYQTVFKRLHRHTYFLPRASQSFPESTLKGVAQVAAKRAARASSRAGPGYPRGMPVGRVLAAQEFAWRASCSTQVASLASLASLAFGTLWHFVSHVFTRSEKVKNMSYIFLPLAPRTPLHPEGFGRSPKREYLPLGRERISEQDKIRQEAMPLRSSQSIPLQCALSRYNIYIISKRG